MSGNKYLAKLMASVGITAAASAPAVAVAAGVPELSAEQEATGTSQMERLVEAAQLDGQNEGRRLERERFGAVLTDDAATGRLGLAITLLNTTDNSAEQIITCLQASPKAEAVAPPAAPAAVAPAGQQKQAVDPLKSGADPIAQDTPLVDTGNPSGNAEDQDQVDVAAIWGPAIDSAAASVGVASNGFSANGLGRQAA